MSSLLSRCPRTCLERLWLVGGFAAGAAFLNFTGPATAQSMHVATNDPVMASMTGTSVERGQTRNAASLDVRISVDFDRRSLRDALRDITQKTGVEFDYADALIPSAHRVTFQASNVSARDVVQRMLAQQGLALGTVLGTHASIVARKAGPAVQGTITGRVISAKTKQPVVGARVYLGDDTKGVVTGDDGAFRISAPAGDQSLRIQAVGYTRTVRKVTVAEDGTVTVDVALEPSASVLDEVVVTGSVVATERREIPTPITVITAEDIQRRGITRLEEVLRGEVPGVIAFSYGTSLYSGDQEAMARADVYVRGSSTIMATPTQTPSPSPLKTYVDGIELADPGYLNTIDPQSIERIEIVTGPQAATIYGSGAMGGVMQIFTKKGTGASRPDLSLAIRYGTMQNNLSNTLAPSHEDRLNISGGLGTAFSYSGNLSHEFSGQWRPGGWRRSFNGQVGVRHGNGPFAVSGSVSLTAGQSGVLYYNPTWVALTQSGDRVAIPTMPNPQKRYNTSQTSSLVLDYNPGTIWQHQARIGRNTNEFTMEPQEPLFQMPRDTMFQYANSSNVQMTWGYNATFMAPRIGVLSNVITAGATGTSGKYDVQQNVCKLSKVSPELRLCPGSSFMTLTTQDRSNWGGFAHYKLGVFDRLFLSAAVRGERNPFYGQQHKIDWTPNVGATYSVDLGELTVKFLASYGKATRPPAPNMREAEWTFLAAYEPSQYILIFANPDLRPEYSRGPQGGIELYYGNIGSFTINRYVQSVTDLIQRVQVDSIYLQQVNSTFGYWRALDQYRNTARIRQHGIESTGTLNFSAFTIRGTWSWTDSRVDYVDPLQFGTAMHKGQSFVMVPTHTGSISLSYARGPASFSWITNVFGKSLRNTNDLIEMQMRSVWRLPMYQSRITSFSFLRSEDAYAKSDLTASYRLTPWAQATLNIKNVDNQYQSETTRTFPSLGRETLVGISLRYPISR